MARREALVGAPTVEDDGTASPTTERRPRLVVALGRGRTGKTVLLSWLAETAQREAPLRIIDADINNPVLSTRFRDAEIPEGVDDDRREWLEKEVIDRLIQSAGRGERQDVLLDMGGGDLLVKRWGAELRLADVLEDAGVDAVALHLLGPDKADLAYLEDVEARALFCPDRTALILNRGLVSANRSAAEAFREVLASDVVRKVRERGGKVIVMPPLGCMAAVERAGLRFQQALEPTSPIGPLDRVRVRRWLEVDMPAMREGLGEWIP